MAKGKVIKLALKKKAKKSHSEARQLYGIKQGVGAVTTRAFPRSTIRKRTKKTGGNGFRGAFNALSQCHLPLPRAVGGYTIIKTTDVITTSLPAMLFGTFKGPGHQFTETTWMSTIGVSNTSGGYELPIGGYGSANTGNAYFYASEALAAGSLDGSRMVPAAITVQIMNGEALQHADGIVYIGRAKTVLDLMGDTRTWKEVMQQLVSYSAPRLCSAGKLALRGVQVNAVPNNLSVLSDFVPRRIHNEGVSPWTEVPATPTDTSTVMDFEGFGPIFVHNPQNVNLQYLVTIEWRMRFDPFNPAYAGHTSHVPASEQTWARAVAQEEASGNGVRDIVEEIAIAGAMATMGA